MADVVIVNKASMADKEDLALVLENIRNANPCADVVLADSEITVEDPSVIRGHSVLVVEDGPTLTHGGMSYGAGTVAARKFGAKSVVDPRKYAVGPIAAAYKSYPHMGAVLPALGYYPEQLEALEKTINAARCDAVVIGTPVDLRRFLKLNKPAVRVTYELAERKGQPDLKSLVLSSVLVSGEPDCCCCCDTTRSEAGAGKKPAPKNTGKKPAPKNTGKNPAHRASGKTAARK
jgi:predicted GTPase